MAQKLITLDEAIELLGITKERINELREAGKISGYRDGASWKFRSADIERLQADGIDDLAADESFSMSDSALGLPSASAQAQAPAPPSDDLELGDLELGDLELGDLELGAGELGDGEPLAPQAGGSDLSMLEEEPQDPTATMEDAEIKLTEGMDEGSDADVLGIEPLGEGDDAESILLSEAELGEPLHRPASTIIGRSELAKMQAADAARKSGIVIDDEDDLDLALVEDKPRRSDVNLAASMSDVHSTEDSGILGSSASANKAKFEDLDELEIDLEAESSRILEAEDVAKARAAAAKHNQSTGKSDLKLDDDFGLAGISDLGLAASSSATGQGKPEPKKPEAKKVAPPQQAKKAAPPKKEAAVPGLSALGLTDDDEDDFVLGDSGSDMGLSAGDSGINLRPSDSGISLGEAPLDLGGSAMGSSLNLGAALSSAAAGAKAKKSKDEEFLLTPLEAEESEEEEDSSQIIALDDLEEGEAPGFVADDDGDAGFESFEDASPGGFGAPAMAGAGVAGEQQFGGVVNSLLVLCLLAMTLCGALVVDLFNSLWSWKEPFALNSSIMDGLLSMIGK